MECLLFAQFFLDDHGGSPAHHSRGVFAGLPLFTEKRGNRACPGSLHKFSHVLIHISGQITTVPKFNIAPEKFPS